MEQYGIIYKVKNLKNNKIYIGQTTENLEERKRKHYRSSKIGSSFVFHQAIRKYEKNSFEWKIICKCCSPKELNEQEEYYINFYNSWFGNYKGYNMSLGGRGQNGYKHSKETLEKLSGENHWTAKISYPEIAKKKISESMLGKKNHFFGKKHTNENKIKQGLKNIGNQYRAKKFIAIDPEGVEIECFNISKFCRDMKMRRGSVKNVLSNKWTHYRGWKFYYEDN